jgi:peptide deformylase
MDELVYYPDLRLSAPNRTVSGYTEEMLKRLPGMFEIMYQHKGVGLAAPQIGWNIRLFVMNPTPEDRNNERIFWNPQVTTSGDFVDQDEGCLSVPGVWGKIKRWTEVVLTAQTPDGHTIEKFDGFSAKIIQHEMDHLNGMLYFERMMPAERRRIEPDLKRLRRMGE